MENHIAKPAEQAPPAKHDELAHGNDEHHEDKQHKHDKVIDKMHDDQCITLKDVAKGVDHVGHSIGHQVHAGVHHVPHKK